MNFKTGGGCLGRKWNIGEKKLRKGGKRKEKERKKERERKKFCRIIVFVCKKTLKKNVQSKRM